MYVLCAFVILNKDYLLTYLLMTEIPVSDGSMGGAMGAIAPCKSKMTLKIFLNLSENKSSDRKLSLIPFMSSALYVK